MKDYNDKDTLIDILLKIRFVTENVFMIASQLSEENQQKFEDEFMLLATISKNLPFSNNNQKDEQNIMAADNCLEAMFDLYRPFIDATYEVFKKQNMEQLKRRINQK